MAGKRAAGWLARLLFFAILVAVSAQFSGKRVKPKSPTFKSDIKYIQCDVCDAMAKEARNTVKLLKAEARNLKVKEADILERIEKMCDPDQDEGDWITRYDIVESAVALKLHDTGAMGKCKSECRTIARACEQIHEEVDLTDLSAMLYQGAKRAAIFNWMCHDSTDVCAKKAPALPAGRTPIGETHIAMEEDEIRTTKMMRNMKASGLSGTMYDRETMEQELAEMQDTYGDDPDFNKVFTESGLASKLPGRAAGSSGDPEPADGAASGVAAAITDTVAKAAEAIKDGASKAAEMVSSFTNKMFDRLGGAKKVGQGAEL